MSSPVRGICFLTMFLSCLFSTSSTNGNLMACGYYEQYHECVTCNTDKGDHESFFNNYGKKVPQNICQTPIKTFYKEIVFDGDRIKYFLVVGLEAKFTTIQHTKEVLIKVDLNCPREGSCNRLGSEYFVIYLPDLMPSHAPILKSMKIYLPLPASDIKNYEHIFVISHSKDACDGQFTQYVVEVNPDQIETVFLTEASLEICNKDVKTVLRGDVSRNTTSPMPPGTTALTTVPAKTKNADSSSNRGVIIACVTIFMIITVCSALAFVLYIRHRKGRADNGNPMVRVIVNPPPAADAEDVVAPAPINIVGDDQMPPPEPANYEQGQVYVPVVASGGNSEPAVNGDQAEDPPQQVLRLESPHPNNAFLFEWTNRGNEQLGTPRDSFYAPVNAQRNWNVDNERSIAPNSLQQNPGPSNVSVENTIDDLPSNQDGDRRSLGENPRDAEEAPETPTTTGGNYFHTAESSSGPPFFE